METKSAHPQSAIQRLVQHHGGPARTAALISAGFHYQQVQQWVERGWASPMHFLRLEQLLPDGLTLRDLYADRERNGSAGKVAQKEARHAA